MVPVYTKKVKETYRKLPTKLYRVRIPTIATYSEAELDLYGIPNSYKNGVPIKNDHLEMSTVELPIARLIDVYENGYPIKIVDEKDSVEIYNSLEQYIKDWSADLRTSPNMRYAKVDNDYLLLIERFISEIFDHNRTKVLKEVLKANQGYDMSVGFMPTSTMMSPVANREAHVPKNNVTGVLDRYGRKNKVASNPQQQTPVPIAGNYNYNSPTIDRNKIERKPLIDKYGNITYSVNDLNNKDI